MARQRSLILLIAFLVAVMVSCTTTRKQPHTYEECMSLCSDQVSHCTQSCNTWKWSAEKLMDCVNKCNQKNAECLQQCSELKGSISEPVQK